MKTPVDSIKAQGTPAQTWRLDGMKKSELFWPCMGSMGSLSALAYVLFLAVLYFGMQLTEATHSEVYSLGFKSVIQPILVSLFLINHILLGWKFKTILPVLGFLAGFPLAVFIVGIAGRIGAYSSEFIRFSGIQQFTVSLIVQIVLVGALAARGLSDMIKLYKNDPIKTGSDPSS